MKRKKIDLWFIHSHSPVESGGVQITNLNLANELSRYGFRPNIITAECDELKKTKKIRNVNIHYIKDYDDLKKILNKNGVFQINISFSLREMEIRSIEYLSRINKKFIVSFRTFPTIIPYSSLKNNPTLFYRRMIKLKSLLNKESQSQQAVGYSLSLQMGTNENNRSKLRGIKPIWSNKNLIISPSDIAQDSISFFNLKKIKTIRNFVKYYNKKEIVFNKRKYDFIFVGRLYNYKNIQELILAFFILLRKKPDLKLAILGSGPDKKSIKNLSKSLGILKNVMFTGDIKHEKVHEYLQNSKILVLPSYTELCPNCIVEGFLNKNKIIASNIPANINLLQNGKLGMLYSIGNPEDLAEIMERSLKKPIGKKLENIKKRTLLEFSSKKLIKKYCNLYKKYNNELATN